MDVKERLEYLRSQIDDECISMSEIAELQGLAEHIDPTDVVLLEWAGVPEFPDDAIKLVHGGNESLVLELIEERPALYGPGAYALARGNGMWYVGMTELDDTHDPRRLWSPNGYAEEGTARDYFDRETKRGDGLDPLRKKLNEPFRGR